MKRACPLLILLGLLLIFFISPVLAESHLRGFDPSDKSLQYVSCCNYPYEKDGTVRPVLWRVLSVEDDQALLLTEYVIDTKQIIFETDKDIISRHAFRRISSYTESDLFVWLNSECLDTLLDGDPLRNALVEHPEYGYLHPLTSDQYMDDTLGFRFGKWGEELNAFPERQGVGTPYAKSRGLFVHTKNGKSPFWCIAIKSPADYKFGLVGYNGHISWGSYTNIKVGGLRLAIHLDLNKIRIAGGEGTKENPFTLAFSGDMSVSGSTDLSSLPGEESQPETGPEEPVATVPEENEDILLLDDAPDDQAEAESETPANGTALVSLIGDCSLGDSVGSVKMTNSYHSVIRENGYAWPFSLVHDILSADDLTIANLEVVLTGRTNHKDITYPLKGLPEHVNILTEGSVEAVNTVNNHCYDFDRAGYTDTLAALDDAGIAHFGSINYRKDYGFEDILIRDINGIRFGIFGFCYPQDYDLKHICALIRDLKENRQCDVIIASMHWGREGFTEPSGLTPMQRNLSEVLIDNGVDVVYGHHPHVLQPLVFYKDKPILFSTGNFTFGTINTGLDQHTGIFRLTFARTDGAVRLRKLEVIPCMVGKKGDYRPSVIEDQKEREKTFRILSPRKKISSFVKAPESFLSTGIVLFDDQGAMMD